jgi:hypothetical protein
MQHFLPFPERLKNSSACHKPSEDSESRLEELTEENAASGGRGDHHDDVGNSSREEWTAAVVKGKSKRSHITAFPGCCGL